MLLGSQEVKTPAGQMNATRVWLNMQKQGHSEGLEVYRQLTIGRRSIKQKLQQQEQNT